MAPQSKPIKIESKEALPSSWKECTDDEQYICDYHITGLAKPISVASARHTALSNAHRSIVLEHCKICQPTRTFLSTLVS